MDFASLFRFEGDSQKLRQTLFLLLLLTIISISLSVEVAIIGDTKMQLPLEPLIGISALLTFVLFIKDIKTFRAKFTDVAVLVFFAGAILSSIFAKMPVIADKATAALIAYGVTLYGGFRVLRLRRLQWDLVWKAHIAAFTVLSVYTIFNYFNLGVDRQESYKMGLPFIPGHTLLMAIGFPAFLYALNQSFRKIGLKYNIPFILLFIFLTVISFSRIYWVIVLTFLFIHFFYYFKQLRISLFVGAVLFFIIGGSVYHYIDKKRDREHAWDDPEDHNSVFVQIQSIFVWYKNESNIERGNRWKVAWHIFKDFPLTGTGLNTYPEVYVYYMDKVDIQETNLSCNKMNAHQLYSGWLSDMGLIGFIGGLLVLVAFLKAALNRVKTKYFMLCLLLVVNFLLLGIIEDFTTLEKIMSVFWLSLAFVQSFPSER